VAGVSEKKAIFRSVIAYNKSLSSQCKLSSQIEQMLDKIVLALGSYNLYHISYDSIALPTRYSLQFLGSSRHILGRSALMLRLCCNENGNILFTAHAPCFSVIIFIRYAHSQKVRRSSNIKVVGS